MDTYLEEETSVASTLVAALVGRSTTPFHMDTTSTPEVFRGFKPKLFQKRD